MSSKRARTPQAHLDPERRRLLASIEEVASRAAIEGIARSVAVIIHDDGTRLFSGTFVRHGPRSFVLTARHCVEQVKNWDNLRILSYGARASSIPAATRGRIYATHPDDFRWNDVPRLDIGCILLHEQLALTLQANWVTLDRLSSATVRGGDVLLFSGFPAQLAKRKPVSSGRVSTGVEPMHFFGLVPKRAPTRLDRPAEKHIDVFVHYDIEDLVRVGSEAPVQPVEPAGISGCGLFRVERVRRRGLWSPGPLPLVGVQSTYYEERGLLRATRSEFALRLLDEVIRRAPLWVR